MIRIATIGTSIITGDFIQVLNESADASFAGACSRDAARAAAFTAEHGGARPFTSVTELAAAPDVDAVYIASPNALHAEQALACIEGGKHVLVEKSFCANRAQAARVLAEAEAAGVAALEAMRPLHDPALAAIAGALPELGRIRRATLRFGKYSSRYDDVLAGRHTNIFDCRMATGSLMDIGVYAVEPMLALFGEPAAVTGAAVLLDEETRGLTGGAIDGAGTVTAAYPHMVAALAHSKITTDLAPNQIEGERGTLTFEEVSMPRAARIDLRAPAARDGATSYSGRTTRTRELALPACANTMAYELADFVRAAGAVRGGAGWGEAAAGPFGTLASYRDLTLAALGVMDEVRRQTGVRFPADDASPAR